jgi:hypothetical protein
MTWLTPLIAGPRMLLGDGSAARRCAGACIAVFGLESSVACAARNAASSPCPRCRTRLWWFIRNERRRCDSPTPASGARGLGCARRWRCRGRARCGHHLDCRPEPAFHQAGFGLLRRIAILNAHCPAQRLAARDRLAMKSKKPRMLLRHASTRRDQLRLVESDCHWEEWQSGACKIDRLAQIGEYHERKYTGINSPSPHPGLTLHSAKHDGPRILPAFPCGAVSSLIPLCMGRVVQHFSARGNMPVAGAAPSAAMSSRA